MCNLNIYIVKIPPFLSAPDFSNFISCIPLPQQKKIKKYVHQKDAIRSLIGQLLLQNVIQKERNVLKGDLIFKRNKYGKPYVYNLQEYHFNISHSGDYVVCVTHNRPVGIDIEFIKPVSLEIAKHYFSKEEYESIMRQPEDSRISYFYDFWTMKESFIKAIGKGLHIPLNSFVFKVTEEKEFILKVNPYSGKFYFKQYHINSEHKLSVCSKAEDFPQRVTEIKYTNLITDARLKNKY